MDTMDTIMGVRGVTMDVIDVIDVMDVVNPYSFGNTWRKLTKEEKPSDTVEGLSGGSVVGSLFIQLLCFVISLYTGYIFARCYCQDFKSYAGASVMMMCCTPCFIPYLYFQRFVNKCGISQIGKP